LANEVVCQVSKKYGKGEKRQISNGLVLITWQKRKLWTTQFFCRAFLLPACRVNVRGKFISAEALRSHHLCMAAQSLAAGVFASKNDPKSIDGVRGVDGRPIGKNTNNWDGIDGVPDVDERPMGSS